MSIATREPSAPGLTVVQPEEVADLNEAGPPDPAQVAELAAQAGLEMAQPDWLADVIARYDLTQPLPG